MAWRSSVWLSFNAAFCISRIGVLPIVDEQRAIYRRDEDRYASNLTDAEWERLKPLTPEALPGGRPRKTDMRAAMNAIFYLLRTAALGAICRATNFRRARRSTILSASSTRTACRRPSEKSCI